MIVGSIAAEVPVTLEQLAEVFWDMSSFSQARFFEEVAALAIRKSNGVLGPLAAQCHAVGMDLRTMRPEARFVLQQIGDAVDPEP
jgi:hypothetical protein